MTKKELDQWYLLRKRYLDGELSTRDEEVELVRLNHLIMEASHKIHNDNMIALLNS